MQESNLVREKKKFQVIGTRPKRPDGTDKVTGRALYGGDINLPSMIYGEILRSPHAHAKIISIDYQEALAIEGVKAVITAEDFPSLEDVTKKVGEGAVNIRYRSNNILAKEKVLYQGHPIAAVAAKDKNIARLAIEKIIVKYEILSPVLDVREAMKEDAPILLEELRTVSMGEKIDKPTNIAKHIQLKRGNI
ncbi:MAG: xanthine dehydrogenase family protein molybdopterin-binding subunit, partial [Candidatus Heimdallarchaeota archaeon]|nr:xanthine dehydrogenase family protein molybdopterin-binding subunit [Candidatus Heimdallarchaeota archaeon]